EPARRSCLLGLLEDDLATTKDEVVIVRQLGPVAAFAVGLAPCRGAKVDDPPASVLPPDLRMAARDIRVLERDVGLARASQDGALLRELRALPAYVEEGARLVREPELL